MGTTSGVWGIDIGQCALKALRCELAEDEQTIVATAFDYIEYPKILSQPEADPEQLVKEALETFLSRNKLKYDRVTMSVSGQSGLARFFKPPPVEAKRLPDIVKYEARQQIPFPLEEVVWDWQQLAGGQEVEGFALEAEVGLFAMKREQVFKSIRPFALAAIELELIQLAPLCIYNFVTHDLLNDAQGEFDPSDPPESWIVLSMGTDTTDLVITNGYRVWQRSIPLGGNHFTKQLTKELKLTFAKAEHLKRNARQAEDPKTVFQAMRPVFNDLVTEVQRSIGYFQNIDRKAKIGKVIVLGNTTKLPGLQQYLSKNLGYDVVDYQTFRRLGGEEVVNSPAFKDNLLGYGVCYGLCLQGLNHGKLSTNLLPREILTQRLVREKKPWTLAAVGALLLACSLNFFFRYNTWYTVNPDRTIDGTSWKEATGGVSGVKNKSKGYVETDDKHKSDLQLLKSLGDETASNSDRRLSWMELLAAIHAGLPPRTPGEDPSKILDPDKVAFQDRQDLHIEYIETEYFPDIKQWFTPEVAVRYQQGKRIIDNDAVVDKSELAEETAPAANAVDPKAAAAQNGAPASPATGAIGPAVPPAAPDTKPAAPAAPASPSPAQAATVTGPEKDGWVVELRGYHYFNTDRRRFGPNHVYKTIVKHIEKGEVLLPTKPGEDAKMEKFTLKELGISYPTLLISEPLRGVQIPNPQFEASAGEGGAGPGGAGPSGMGPGGMGPGGGIAGLGAGVGAAGAAGKNASKGKPAGNDKKKGENEPKPFFEDIERYNFTIQFCWQPVPLAKRLELLREKQKKEKEEADRKQAGNTTTTPSVANNSNTSRGG